MTWGSTVNPSEEGIAAAKMARRDRVEETSMTEIEQHIKSSCIAEGKESVFLKPTSTRNIKS